MSDYDTFAPFYDTAMGDRGDVIALLRAEFERHHPQARSLLELGCGTGTMLQAFNGKYSLAGIDMSANMLQIAQRKLPKSTFVEGTIAGFELHETFDIIICVFDTINHLTNFEDWQKLLQSAKKHLRTNGLFIFDMDTVSRLRTLTGVPGYRQELGDTTIDMSVLSVSPNEVQWHLTIQEPGADGIVQVFEEHVHEASYPLPAVRAELEKHFEILDSFDSDHRPPEEASDRVYFVCRPLTNAR